MQGDSFFHKIHTDNEMIPKSTHYDSIVLKCHRHDLYLSLLHRAMIANSECSCPSFVIYGTELMYQISIISQIITVITVGLIFKDQVKKTNTAMIECTRKVCLL